VDIPLQLPVQRAYRFLVTSSDVLHSFAVPELGVKIDAVPGRLSQYLLQIERPGVFLWSMFGNLWCWSWVYAYCPRSTCLINKIVLYYIKKDCIVMVLSGCAMPNNLLISRKYFIF